MLFLVCTSPAYQVHAEAQALVKAVPEPATQAANATAAKTEVTTFVYRKGMKLTQVGGEPLAKAAPAEKSAGAAPVKVGMISPIAVASVESAPKVKPEKATATAHTLSPELKQAITDAVKSWAAAWAAKDVEKYLASYAPDFKPADGMNHKAWDAQRRERVTRSKSIALSEIAVDEAGEKTVNVSFVQVYRSDIYKDTTKKTLKLKKIGDKWLIVSEQTGKK